VAIVTFMAYEIAGNPQEVAHFAGEVLKSATAITDSLDTAQRGMTLSASAFGNSEGASGISDKYQDAVDGCTGTVSRLQTVLTNDVDGLYQTAFAIQNNDQANANKLNHIN